MSDLDSNLCHWERNHCPIHHRSLEFEQRSAVFVTKEEYQIELNLGVTKRTPLPNQVQNKIELTVWQLPDWLRIEWICPTMNIGVFQKECVKFDYPLGSLVNKNLRSKSEVDFSKHELYLQVLWRSGQVGLHPADLDSFRFWGRCILKRPTQPKRTKFLCCC